MDVEDEVLKEFDVYLNSNEDGNVFLFQYPLQTKAVNVHKVKAKPQNKVFEIEVADSGLSLKKRKRENAKGWGDRVDKQTYQSLHVKPTVPYVLGLVRSDRNELHLTPVDSVFQFRPDMRYLDSSAAEIKQAEKEDRDGNSSQSETETPAVKAITMRFAGPNEEKLKKARESSYAFKQQKVATEEWIDLTYHSSVSTNSANATSGLICTRNAELTKENSGQTVGSLESYLQTLTFKSTKESGNAVSLVHVKTLPLPDQVRIIMTNAKVMPFDELLNFLSESCDAASVLRSLQQVAMIVQGNWVVKSEILYPKKNDKDISPASGIPIDNLCRARDYVSWMYTQKTSLVRKELIEFLKIPEEDIMLILKQLAKYNTWSKSWDFVFPRDDAFIERHPDVVQRQKMLWDARHSQIERNYSGVRIKTEPGTTTSTSPRLSITAKSGSTSPNKRRRSKRE